MKTEEKEKAKNQNDSMDEKQFSSEETQNQPNDATSSCVCDDLAKKVEELTKKIEELEKENADYKDRLLRRIAEFENYKRRVEQEIIDIRKYAAEGFIKKILKIYDDFERSLKHIEDKNSNYEAVIEGIKLIRANFNKVFEEEGIKKIDSVGKPFDHRFHEALMQVHNDKFPPNTVVEEHEAGYLYKDKVIRYAKVIVNSELNPQNNGSQS